MGIAIAQVTERLARDAHLILPRSEKGLVHEALCRSIVSFHYSSGIVG